MLFGWTRPHLQHRGFCLHRFFFFFCWPHPDIVVVQAGSVESCRCRPITVHKRPPTHGTLIMLQQPLHNTLLMKQVRAGGCCSSSRPYDHSLLSLVEQRFEANGARAFFVGDRRYIQVMQCRFHEDVGFEILGALCDILSTTVVLLLLVVVVVAVMSRRVYQQWISVATGNSKRTKRSSCEELLTTWYYYTYHTTCATNERQETIDQQQQQPTPRVTPQSIMYHVP